MNEIRKTECFQIYRALISIIFIMAAQSSYTRPKNRYYTKAMDPARSQPQTKEHDTPSDKSTKVNRHILFNGGGSIWHGAEYSQYEHFLAWYQWSIQQPNSKTISIFSDGFRNENNSLELYEILHQTHFSETDMPNIISMEDGEIVYRRASFPNNFPATYTSLKERFEEANHQTHDLLIVIGDHGLSLVSKRDNYCQLASEGNWDSSYKAIIQLFGFTDLNARDSLIMGWYGIFQEKDLYAALVENAVEGRVNQFISSQDLIRMRDELSISGDLKFVASQCYSGAVAWMAFDSSRQKLRGDTCGITASTFYYQSSGCSLDPNVKTGHGYWVSKGITEQVDIDGDGETSLLDLHLYALVNDEDDRGPQITSGIALQQKGLLPWPVEIEKDFIVNQDSFPNIFKSGQSNYERTCTQLSHIFKETQDKVQDQMEAVSLTEENERKLSQLKVGLNQNNAFLLDEARKRYKLYLKAEQMFLELATTEEIEAYLNVKKCETSAIR